MRGNDQEVAGINIRDYKKRKDAGFISVAKVGDAFAIAVKAFDPESGLEGRPQVYGIAIEDVKAQKENMVKASEDLQILITDLEALK